MATTTFNDVVSVTADELGQRLESESPILIDVRTPAEFREVHATSAKNFPLESLNPGQVIDSGQVDLSEPLYVICRSGNRSRQACRKFLDAGYFNVVNVEGGTAAWESAGHPVVRGKKTISLERQVRIAAGFLVLLGIGLSFVNIAFLGISAFVGAGLIFAGVTDTCGMGMLLAKMPWNQVGCSSNCCTIEKGSDR